MAKGFGKISLNNSILGVLYSFLGKKAKKRA